jgi:phage baseplate assembly protein W
MQSLGFGENTWGANFGIEEIVNTDADLSKPTAARFIDSISSDFNLSGNALESMPATRQRVLIALLTKKGSSSVLPDFGNQLLNVGKVNSAIIVRQVQDYIRQALKHIEEMNITAINVDPYMGDVKISYEVVYIDLITNEEDSIRL